MMTKAEELKSIRNEFGASKHQFATIFLGGLHPNTLYQYERGTYVIPEAVIRLARFWKKTLNDVQGNK